MGTTGEPELNTDPPDFKDMAKGLLEDPMDLIYKILLRHTSASIEEMFDQIQRRNRRIRNLESLLRRAYLRIDDADFRDEISKELDDDHR